MRDALVFHHLIATPCFYKQSDAGQGGVILQRRHHQTVWKLGHLKHLEKRSGVRVSLRVGLIGQRGEQHTPGHFEEGGVQLWTVCHR